MGAPSVRKPPSFAAGAAEEDERALGRLDDNEDEDAGVCISA